MRPAATPLEALLDGAPVATIFALSLVGIVARRAAEQRAVERCAVEHRGPHHRGTVCFARTFAAYAVFISVLSCVSATPYLAIGASLSFTFPFVEDDLAHAASAICLIGAYALGAFCWGFGTYHDEADCMRWEGEAPDWRAVPAALFLGGTGFFMLAVAPEANVLGAEAGLPYRALRVVCLMLVFFVLTGACKSLTYRGHDGNAMVAFPLLGTLMGYVVCAALPNLVFSLDLRLLAAVVTCISCAVVRVCAAAPVKAPMEPSRFRPSQDEAASSGCDEHADVSPRLDVLTTREREAMEARWQGLSSNEAAVQMGVKPSTVRNLQARAQRKLDLLGAEHDASNVPGEESSGVHRGAVPDSAPLNARQQPLTSSVTTDARPINRLPWIVAAMLVLVLWVPIRQRMLALIPLLTPPVNHRGILVGLGVIAGTLVLCARWVSSGGAIARSVCSAFGSRVSSGSRWGAVIGLLVLTCCLIAPAPRGIAYHAWEDVLNVFVFAGSALLAYAVGAHGDVSATPGELKGDDASPDVPAASIEPELRRVWSGIVALSACAWGCIWAFTLFAARSEFVPAGLFDPLLALFGAASLWGLARRQTSAIRSIALCGVAAGMGLVVSASLEPALLVFSCLSFALYVHHVPVGVGARFARIALVACSAGIVLGLCYSAQMGGVESWLGAVMGTELLVRLGSAGGFMVGTASVALGLCFAWAVREVDRALDAGGGDVALGASARERLEHYFAYRGLNDTQVQVALLVIEGRSRSEIAQQLGYAVGTVNSAKRAIYRRLDVRSQAELVESAKNVLRDS